MKRLLATAFMLALALGLIAQTNDDLAFFQSIWGMGKRAIVEEYMALNATDAAAFWPVYEAYEVSRKELGKERVLLLQDYAGNYATLSPEKATELINRAAGVNIAYQKLLKKTFKKMSKSLDAVKAARFVQLENYFLVMIQMAIQESIPFVEEN